MTLIIRFAVALRLTCRKVVKITGPKYTSLLQMQCQQIMQRGWYCPFVRDISCYSVSFQRGTVWRRFTVTKIKFESRKSISYHFWLFEEY